MIPPSAQSNESRPRPGRFFSMALGLILVLGGAAWYFFPKPADGWSSRKNDREQFIRHRNARLALLPAAPAVPASALPGFNPIDHFLAAQWSRENLPEGKSAPPVCDDTTFLRRVYFDLLGLSPSAEAAQSFLRDSDPRKREKLVEKFLGPEMARGYATHWIPFWEEALASANSDYVGGMSTHGTYRFWLQTCLTENKPYDLMVAELLDPTMPGNKNYGVTSETNRVSEFLGRRTAHETLQSAANVGQVFLGTEMKCASCHNHFLNKEWPQKRFLAFAGLFGSNDLEQVRCEVPSGKTVASAFPFEIPQAPREVPKSINERLHLATMLLVDPANPRFARTLVNRLWKRYFGLGLVEPADDFREDRPASNPALLDWLADDFMRHGYDLKHTIQLILTSRTYQLAYNPALEDHFEMEHPAAARFFRSPTLRRLTAEQFIDSVELQGARSHRRISRDTFVPTLAIALGRPASRQEVSTGRSDDMAVVQALELLNGTELHDLIYSSALVEKLAALPAKDCVSQIYWTVLSRAPSAEEEKVGETFLGSIWGGAAAPPYRNEEVGSVGGGAAAPPYRKTILGAAEKGGDNISIREKTGDLLWALLVSPEFQYIR